MPKTKAPDPGPLAQVMQLPDRYGEGKPRPVNYADLLERYEGWIHHCAQINATAVSEVPIRLYLLSTTPVAVPTRAVKFAQGQHMLKSPYIARKAVVTGGEFEEVAEHPALTILDKPNPWIRGREYFQLLELYLGLTGNSFVFKERGSLGQVIAHWPLPTQYMKIVPGSKAMVDAYIFSRDNIHKIRYDPENIIHLRRPNPSDPYLYGFGEAQSEADMAWLASNIDDYEVGTFRNNARPDFILNRKEGAGQPSEPQRTEMRRTFYQMHSGASNANKMGVLWGGWDIVPLGWSPKDISYLKGEDKVMLRIANAFGVVKSMLTTDEVNLANAAAGAKQYVKRTLLPRLRYIEEALTEDWVSEYDPRLFVAFDDPTPEDEELTILRDKTYVETGIRKVNEIRADHGWEPLEEKPEPTPPPVPPEDEEDEEDDMPKSKLLAISAADAVELNRIHKDDFDEDNPKVQAQIARFATAIRKMFAEQLAEFDEWLKWPADLRLAKQLCDLLKAPGNPEAYIAQLRAKLEEVSAVWADRGDRIRAEIQSTIREGGENAIATLRVTQVTIEVLPFDVFRPEVTEFLDAYVFKFLKGVNNTTVEAFREQLSTALLEGESIPMIRDRIKGVFADATDRRAALIARSETSRAMHAGRIQAWKQAGIKRITWLAADDPCEYCSALDGRTIEIHERFAQRGDIMEGAEGGRREVTYSSIGHPPAHPACRCTTLAEIAEIAEIE